METKGIKAVKKAKKIIQNNVFQWLLNNGLSDANAKEVLCELPIIYAVKNESKNINISTWCFMIEEKMRNFDNVLAVSVDADNKEVIDNYFFIPTKDFTKTNFIILIQNGYLYNSYKIESSTVEDTIVKLILKHKELILNFLLPLQKI